MAAAAAGWTLAALVLTMKLQLFRGNFHFFSSAVLYVEGKVAGYVEIVFWDVGGCFVLSKHAWRAPTLQSEVTWTWVPPAGSHWGFFAVRGHHIGGVVGPRRRCLDCAANCAIPAGF